MISMSLDKNSLQKLEKIIRTLMRNTKTPGLAISIYKDNKIVYSNGFGARDLKKGLPMTPQTLIGVGSVTKSFTAMGIMILVERGVINLEDSVSKFINKPPFSNRPEIQIQHMLSHSTGIPACDAGIMPMFYHFDDFSRVCPMFSREDFLAHTADASDFIIFSPGQKFFYNNDMFTCLGYIIEQISGKKYSDFIRTEIFEKLSMDRAVITESGFQSDPMDNKMSGYISKNENSNSKLVNNRVPIDELLEAPGGIHVSMEEMMNYVECLLNQGEFRGKRILKPESIQKLWSPKLECPYGYTSEGKYGLGWVIDNDYFRHKIVHHGGGLGTSCAHLMLVPELNFGVSIAINSCTLNTSLISQVVYALLLDKVPNEEIFAMKATHILKEIEGEYFAQYDMYSMKISNKGGFLKADLEIDDGKLSFPIMISNLDELKFKVCNSLLENEKCIQFMRDPQSHQIKFASFDRYLYRKQ